MRRLLPFIWLAVAVAAGVALAPYFWWLTVATVLFLAVCVCAALIRRAWWRLTARFASWQQRE